MAREMKDSGVVWSGEVPADWSMIRMKNCIKKRDGGAWGEDAVGDDGDVICLRIADFDYARFRFKPTAPEQLTKRHYSQDVIQKLNLSKNDILIEKSGGGEKTPVGRSVIFDKDYPALFANFMDRLRCKEFVDPEFMQFIFATFYKNDYSKNYIKQTTGIQNLDLTSMLANELVAIPNLKEQKEIAANLNQKCAEIDAVLEKTNTSIEEYKKLKKAIITQTVTRGIRGDRPMKESGIEWVPMIPADWSNYRGKHLFYETNERSETGSEELLTVSHKTGVTPRSQKNVNMFMSESLVGYKICRKGDIAANTMWMWQGAIGVSSYRGVISPSYNTYRQRKGAFDSQYLDYLLRVPPLVELYNVCSTGITASRLRLYPEQFLSIQFIVPPMEEQQEIVRFLHSRVDEMDALIQKKEQFLAELETYKKSLIYNYVTGKKEV